MRQYNIFRTKLDIFLFGPTWHKTYGDVGDCGLRSEVIQKDAQSCPHATLEVVRAEGLFVW